MGDHYKELSITLPEELLQEMNKDEEAQRSMRSNVEICYSLKQPAKEDYSEALRKGYQLMAQINLSFAEMGLTSDINALETYEISLEQESDKLG